MIYGEYFNQIIYEGNTPYLTAKLEQRQYEEEAVQRMFVKPLQ